MISIFLMGGLGNQLFQIFTVIAYALEHKTPFKFKYSETLKTGIERPTYWNSFLKNLKCFTTSNDSELKLPLLRENSFEYTEIPHIEKDFMLYGYYQSYKYFEKHYDSIKRLIQLNKQQEQVIVDYPEYFANENTITMHFRLGDYKEKQQYHPVMKLDYYRNALQHIINETEQTCWNILYFCQEEDNETVNNNIDVLKSDFPELQFIKVGDTIEDWKQMLIMSCCKHNIIANSSFSWWGAYFNENSDKIVCYPNIWFGPAIKHNDTSGLFLNFWSCIQ